MSICLNSPAEVVLLGLVSSGIRTPLELPTWQCSESPRKLMIYIVLGLPGRSLIIGPFYCSWFKRQGPNELDRALTSEVDRDLKFIGGSLYISRVDKSKHEGYWTCQARNDFGYENKTFKLTVTGELRVTAPGLLGKTIFGAPFRTLNILPREP